jgi:uncharacterized protein YxjI
VCCTIYAKRGGGMAFYVDGRAVSVQEMMQTLERMKRRKFVSPQHRIDHRIEGERVLSAEGDMLVTENDRMVEMRQEDEMGTEPRY